MGVSPWIIGLVVIVGLVYAWVLVRAMVESRRGGVANRPVAALVGGPATAQTVIAPTGIAYAGGESWSARSRTADIRAGTALRVVAVDGLELVVEPMDSEPDTTPEG